MDLSGSWVDLGESWMLHNSAWYVNGPERHTRVQHRDYKILWWGGQRIGYEA